MQCSKLNKKGLLAILLSVSVVFATLLPSSTHLPNYIETLQEHRHLHRIVEDMFWALHGHSHDTVDHDHSQAVLVSNTSSEPLHALGSVLVFSASSDWPSQLFRIDRPPRI